MPHATAAITTYVKASRRTTTASPCACTSTPPIARPDRGRGGHQGLLGGDELADPVVAHGPSEHRGPGRVGDGKAELQGDDGRSSHLAWATEMHAAICTTLASGISRLAPARSRARAISWVQVW